MTAFRYEEYGVVINAGPHKGMVLATRRSHEAAQEYINDPSMRQGYELVVWRRAVVVGEWHATTMEATV